MIASTDLFWHFCKRSRDFLSVNFFIHLCLVSFSGRDPLVRELYEFDEQVEDLSQGVWPMSRALWKYRQHVTVEGLSSYFQREVPSSGEQEYKVLNAFLKQVSSRFGRKY